MERLEGPINSCFFEEEEEEEEGIISLRFEEEESDFCIQSFDETMPFLQMLQTVGSIGSPPFFPFQEPNFQLLSELQNNTALEPESCVTHETESKLLHHCQPKTKLKHATTTTIPRDRRKRKRTRPLKNKEEVESQRMTHIAVERNRRRQMNDHLNALRSLMPVSYVQRGDQASIVGGAIDFVKELEQLLHSLETQQRINNGVNSAFFTTLQHDCGEEFTARNKSEAAEIVVTVIQNHVNLKIHCERKPGQLLKTIIALQEELGLTVLHLNVTSSNSSALYSFNLRIEEECKLGLAGEIAAAVHQMFMIMNG